MCRRHRGIGHRCQLGQIQRHFDDGVQPIIGGEAEPQHGARCRRVVEDIGGQLVRHAAGLDDLPFQSGELHADDHVADTAVEPAPRAARGMAPLPTSGAAWSKGVVMLSNSRSEPMGF